MASMWKQHGVPIVALLVCGLLVIVAASDKGSTGNENTATADAVSDDTSTAVADAPIWPMFGHDAQHTGRSQFVGTKSNKLLWSYPTGKWIDSFPVIGVDGVVYFGTNKLYAVNPDGSLKWSENLGTIFASPAIGLDNTVYVGSYGGYLSAISPDGELKWSDPGIDLGLSSPTIGLGGIIYVGSWGNVYAIYPDSNLKWTFDYGESYYSSPAIGTDGTVYVGNIDGKLLAINSDGTLKWSYQTKGKERIRHGS